MMHLDQNRVVGGGAKKSAGSGAKSADIDLNTPQAVLLCALERITLEFPEILTKIYAALDLASLKEDMNGNQGTLKVVKTHFGNLFDLRHWQDLLGPKGPAKQSSREFLHSTNGSLRTNLKAIGVSIELNSELYTFISNLRSAATLAAPSLREAKKPLETLQAASAQQLIAALDGFKSVKQDTFVINLEKRTATEESEKKRPDKG